MTRIKNLLLLIISIPVFIILIWYFAVPISLIEITIEDLISKNTKQSISVSLERLRKGLFFTVYADSIELRIDKTSALTITDISVQINPLQLLRKHIVFSTGGKIGTGNIKGLFDLPDGVLKIENAELDAIPYLTSLGLEANGLLSADITMVNNSAKITFKIPNADIHGTVKGIPVPISSFRKIQGVLLLKENTIKVKSVSLDAKKGYARLKGDVTDGFMNLILELMPSTGEISSIESTLISRYQISPGYYVIPIEGPLL